MRVMVVFVRMRSISRCEREGSVHVASYAGVHSCAGQDPCCLQPGPSGAELGGGRRADCEVAFVCIVCRGGGNASVQDSLTLCKEVLLGLVYHRELVSRLA